MHCRFFYFSFNNMTEAVQSVPDFFSYTDEFLSCPLSRAIRAQDKVMLKRILNKRKETPLPLSVDNRGWSALHVAASRNEYNECLIMLLQHSDSVLIDLNAQTFEGKTALYIACENSCEKNVAFLLQKGCNPNKKVLDRTSPLHIAAMKGYYGIVVHLLEYGININDRDWQNFTPLHLTALYGRTEVCRKLLENEANTDLTDSDNNLPIHLACQNGHFDVVKLLTERECTTSINYQNCDGITPLMLAIQNKNLQCVKYLLDRGAKTEISSVEELIALQFATISGNKDLLELVLQSTDMAVIKKHCFYSFPHCLSRMGKFYSLTCCAINSASIECVSVLLKSKLPKYILEAPFVEEERSNLILMSPLDYLVHNYFEFPIKTFDSLLKLLLDHKMIFMTEFVSIMKNMCILPKGNVVNLFTLIAGDDLPFVKRLHYFNLVSAYGITPDYCLQCYNYNNDSERFKDFTLTDGYYTYYKPVLHAVYRGDIETVHLCLMNSSILEPDKFCAYLLLQKSRFIKIQRPRAMFDFLITLKPIHTTDENITSKLNSNMITKFCYKTYFARSTLQQICRTKIREQVRGETLEDNLKNFKRRIEELPLPVSLKNYLLFK